jgi:pimeloyl-ACP methyl ester carboxylesterase
MSSESTPSAVRPRDQSAVATQDFRVPGSAPGVEIHVRNKRLESQTRFEENKVVIFVHGATFPGSVAFDHPMFGGGSWLDYMALHGFDAYLFDVRGYGKSARPPEMADLPGRNPPYARTPEAIADLATVVDFVRNRAGVAQVNLIGWSWGTAISGGFVSEHNALVRQLAMVAPLWVIRNTPSMMMSRWMASASPWAGTNSNGYLGSWRHVSKKDARERWVRELESRTAEQLMPQAEFDAWWQALLDIEASHGEDGPSIKAPNGVMADLIDSWAANRPTYTPENIRVPTLLVVAEWDVDTPAYMAQELFARLKAAPYKRLEILARGTHSMALELNRVDLYRRVSRFIETRYT